MGIYAFFWSATLLSGLSIRSRIATNLFLFAVFLFVGLRLETGFDWPIYKGIFQDFQYEFSLPRLAVYSDEYAQELGFLLLLGFSAQYFPNYEVFQALVTVALLSSTVALTRAVGVQKVALVVAISFTFLMFNLGFSTLRQTMAISFFNFGLVCYARQRPTWGLVLFFLSTLFQQSSAVYIVAFFAVRYVWPSRRAPAFQAFLIGTAAASIAAPIGIIAISAVSALAAEKLNFYEEISFLSLFGPLDMLTLVFFAVSALLVARGMGKQGPEFTFANDLRRLIMVLAAIGASSSFLLVLRDRVSYEVFLLVSIYLMMPGVRYRWIFVGFFVSFGMVATALNIMFWPTRLAFFPYQNSLVMYALDQKSTGPERSGAFFQNFNELTILAR